MGNCQETSAYSDTSRIASKRHLLVLMPLLLGVGGCASPQAHLSFLNSPAAPIPNQIDSYAFPRTFVDLKAVEGDEIVSMTSRNQPYEQFRVIVARKQQLGVRTNIGLVKVANSDLLAEVGVDTKDERVALIGEVGKLVTGIIPFVGFSSGDPCSPGVAGQPSDPATLPATVDTLGLMIQCGINTQFTHPTDAQNWRQVGAMRVWFGPLPPDARAAIQSDQTPTDLSGKDYSRGIVYAACREMRLNFWVNRKVGDTVKPVEVLRSIYVADPRYFRYVAMPYKGKIKVHSICGVSVETDPAAKPDSSVAIAQALLEQAKAIQAALEKDDASK